MYTGEQVLSRTAGQSEEWAELCWSGMANWAGRRHNVPARQERVSRMESSGGAVGVGRVVKTVPGELKGRVAHLQT